MEHCNENGVRLGDIPVSGTFRIGEHEFVVLDHDNDATVVIRRELLRERMEFGKNNRYEDSYVDAECCRFADEITALVGEGNVVEHTVDLTADDGLKDYGSIRRRASLLTANLYRRYVEVLDQHKIKAWWWLATAETTAKHGNTNWIKCVSPSGCINYGRICYRDLGVRPFCILKSDIFVSV